MSPEERKFRNIFSRWVLKDSPAEILAAAVEFARAFGTPEEKNMADVMDVALKKKMLS